MTLAIKRIHLPPNPSYVSTLPDRSLGYHMLNFIALYLQLYKIFKITRVTLFGTHCMY